MHTVLLLDCGDLQLQILDLGAGLLSCLLKGLVQLLLLSLSLFPQLLNRLGHGCLSLTLNLGNSLFLLSLAP